MVKYHIEKDGLPHECHASKGNCPLASEGEHFTDPAKANEVSQANLENEFGGDLSAGIQEVDNNTLASEKTVETIDEAKQRMRYTVTSGDQDAAVNAYLAHFGAEKLQEYMDDNSNMELGYVSADASDAEITQNIIDFESDMAFSIHDTPSEDYNHEKLQAFMKEKGFDYEKDNVNGDYEDVVDYAHKKAWEGNDGIGQDIADNYGSLLSDNMTAAWKNQALDSEELIETPNGYIFNPEY